MWRSTTSNMKNGSARRSAARRTHAAGTALLAEQFQNRLFVERLFLEPKHMGGDRCCGARRMGAVALGFPSAGGGYDDMTSRKQVEALDADAALSLACCLAEQPTATLARKTTQSTTVVTAAQDLRRRLRAPEGRDLQLHELVTNGVVWIRVFLTAADASGGGMARHDTELELWMLLKPAGVATRARAGQCRFDLDVERTWHRIGLTPSTT